MSRLSLFLLAAVLTAANTAFGQSAFQTQGNGTRSQHVQFVPEIKGNFNSDQKSNVPFVVPVLPQQNGVPAQPAPAPAMPRVAQNAVTQNHQLRIAPEVFEKNLVEKLEKRFVPIRGNTDPAGISRYRLRGRDGTDVELVVQQQQRLVSITGSPKMVESSLQIVRLLDTGEVPGGAVTSFVPVQQSNVSPLQRIAGVVHPETTKIAQANRPTTPNPAAGTAGGVEIGGGVVGPVTIDVIPDINTMVLQGPPGDVEKIKAMIRQLETLSLDNEPIIELVPIQHADSLRIYQLVQQLYQAAYLARRGAITMLPLVKPNTVLIIGRKESIEAAKELIAKLDTEVRPDAAFQIFPLKHAASDLMMNTITSAFANRQGNNVGLSAVVSVISDTRTNTLIAQASPRDLVEIAEMVQKLDIPGSGITSLVRHFPLKNATATNVATILQNAIANVSQQRQAMLSLGSVDAEGNLVRSNVLYNVTILAEVQSNSLLVTAPPDAMQLLEELIQQLDRLPTAESKIRVFTLAHGDAYTLTQVLNSLFQTGQTTNQLVTTRPGMEEGDSALVGSRFVAEIRTNSIIATGGEGDLAVAEALLLRLDAENLNNRKVFTMKLVNTEAEPLAQILTNYYNQDRQVDTLNMTYLMPQSPLEQYQKEITITAEPVTNSLIISTTPRYAEIIRKIILELDERPLMVAIDVLIAEVSCNSSKDRGVEFGLQDSILFDRATSLTPFPGLSAGNPSHSTLNTKTVGTQGITSLIPNTAAANGGFSFSASSESVSILLRALETYNKTQILSRPRLVTLHNRRAQIKVVQVVPYPGNTSYTNQGYPMTGVDQQEVGTTLDVTPRIMPDGMIALSIYVIRSSISGWENISGGGPDGTGGTRAPVFNETSASTTVYGLDGQTVVFAGLISEEKLKENRSIPGLNKIPVVKHFFEYDSTSTKRSELLIVMTPRLIRNREDIDLMNIQERERMHWCVRDVVKLTGDSSVQRRSDEWSPSEVNHTYGKPIILKDSQLPADTKPMLVPTLPVIETK
ncbi:MAG: hypothetical protein LBI05_11420 [Planctomycetaceae bacterium]|nr:hypothetical protein [Planctomycetaceae bacterium]